MRRPYTFTRTSSSHARYNPIYEETEAKKAEASEQSRWSFPFFTSDQPTGYENVKPQPRQSSSPPPRTSGTFFATNHNTYSPTNSTDNIYDAAEKATKPASDQRKRFSFPSFSFFRTNDNNGDALEVDDDYDYRSNSFNDGENRTDPFLDPVDNSKKEKKENQKQKQKLPTSAKDPDNKKPAKSWQERGSAKRTEAKEEKEKAKERERARKRNSGLGWAKSWSFGGERFGGTILADGSGVRMPIFRCKGPCGLACGF
ncbi:uncharacterized protein EAF01_010535 [Botrytis porri]|uniref:Uncharacterized protein n=1 Tax=Botrytis porri TaxID=87229 RepID=A0A4Z1KS97_9HELO|nr:uncharacterized protein EAF01_010535 [Botrytis porri]KAF7892455.1 hypothetical protein EAF01_010535 [Botrytis porri]TGO85449.1 hypothetical protein BPOR_0395g00080 [Botrytis porri]